MTWCEGQTLLKGIERANALVTQVVEHHGVEHVLGIIMQTEAALIFAISNLASQICEKLNLEAVEITELLASDDSEIGRIPRSIAMLAVTALDKHIGHAKKVGIG